MRCLPRQSTRSINNIEMTFLRFPKTWGEFALHPPQFIFPLFGMCVLLIVEWLLETRLNTTMNGTHFAGGDGRMAEAIVRTGYQFAAFPYLTNLSPLQGFGSQLLPLNVWINPVHWPLAVLDGKLATDIAGLVALGCVAAACYFMARCFDVSPLSSIIAAQLTLCWFGPLGPLLTFTASVVLMTGLAAVYAPYIAALGLLARIDPGRTRDFIWYTAAITALILYSLGCDPLWSVVGAVSWAVPFAAVALSPLRMRAILIRCAALGISLAVLLATGALLYGYTLSQYTSRVFFPGLPGMERPFAASYVSILFSSPNAKYFYGLCLLGWIIGPVFAVGRGRVLVVAGAAAFIFFVLYALAYTVLDVTWWLPLPFYVEYCLTPLFIVSAFAGLWNAGQWIITRILPMGTILPAATNVWILSARAWILFLLGSAGQSIVTRIRLPSGRNPLNTVSVRRLALRPGILFLVGVVAVVLVPLGALAYSFERSKIVLARYYSTPWVNEPELVDYLVHSTGLSVGQTFRGSSVELTGDIVSLANLWKRGVPTLDEYSQLVTPQAFYLQTGLLASNPGINGFGYGLRIIPGANIELIFKTLQAMGVRYILNPSPLVEADKRQVPNVRLPRRPHDALPGAEPSIWYVYELRDPNIGNYSPTEIVVASSAPEIIAILGAEDFDFRRRVVLSSGGLSLVAARDMRLTVNRGGGFHVSGKSDGVSLVLLPQQFSHCLKASDSDVRIVRANLLWTGMIFSGSVHADISFGYGMFSPGCRRADIADMKRLGIVLPEPPPTGRQGIKEKFEASVNAFKAVW
jgi:hypothetical protein